MTTAERILQGGRSKAYRPLPESERERAIAAGLAAYEQGDFFEAHELLEPAWMGTRDLPRREAIQGLIKLAAAYVHAVRGNPLGVAKNLAGAQERLDRAVEGGDRGDDLPGVDLVALAARIASHRAILAGALDNAGAELDWAGIVALVPPPSLGPGK